MLPQTRPVPAPHHIRNQPIVPRHHRATHDVTARHHRRLNLPDLDPVSPNLNLAVATADILQHTVNPAPHQVPRPVQPPATTAIPVRNKTRRRQPATAQITPRQTNPAQIQLPHHPNPNQLKMSVQHVPANTTHQPANRNRVPQRRRQRRTQTGADCRLRRPIGVDQPPSRRQRFANATGNASPATITLRHQARNLPASSPPGPRMARSHD